MEQRKDLKESRCTTLVVVLGMHRSGTSTITRAMETLGADFGSRLMPAVAGVNDKGFFEDLDIVAINMEVMAAAGMDWHAMAPIELDRIAPKKLEQLRTKAIATLRNKCNVNTFGLKDPRIARLLPFWQPVFACLDARVVYVIAVRNPISVAQSLLVRNDIPEEKTYVLWLAHVVPALAMTSNCARTLVDYDRLMDSPSQQLERISRQLGLPLNSQAVIEFEREFLDDMLRHTRYTPRDLTLVRSAPHPVKELFAALELAADAEDIRLISELGAAVENGQRFLEEIAPLLLYGWTIERQVEQLSSENVTRLDTIHSLRDELGSRDDTLRMREEVIRPLEELIEKQNAEISNLKKLIEKQQVELAHSVFTNEQILKSTSWRVTAPLRAIRGNRTTRKT
jgi:hypothetical protein